MIKLDDVVEFDPQGVKVLAENLFSAITASGMSQRQFAISNGLTPNTLNDFLRNIEFNGQYKLPTVRLIYRIADLCSIDRLTAFKIAAGDRLVASDGPQQQGTVECTDSTTDSTNVSHNSTPVPHVNIRNYRAEGDVFRTKSGKVYSIA